MVSHRHKVSTVGLLLIGVGLLCTCSSISLSWKAVEAPKIEGEEFIPEEPAEAVEAICEPEQTHPANDPYMMLDWMRWVVFDWSSVDRPVSPLEAEKEAPEVLQESDGLSSADVDVLTLCLVLVILIVIVSALNGMRLRRKRELKMLAMRRNEG